MLPSDLSTKWRSLASLFRDHAEEGVARAYENCADALEEALAREIEVALTLQEAAAESGYSADHLGRLVREGKIPNAGMPNAPRIARENLPKKAGVSPPSTRCDLDRAQIVRSAINAED